MESYAGLYDTIIIGGGPSGLTAGMYCARGGMITLVTDMLAPGGQVATIDAIENFPGFQRIEGSELARRMEEQARQFGVEFLHEQIKWIGKSDGGVQSSDLEGEKVEGGIFEIRTDKRTIRSISVIIATGTEWRKLGIPGEEALRGKGVSYCATCDGPFFKNQEIVVVGGGNTAVQEAIYLSGFARKVKIVHRRNRLRADRILQERAFSNPKVEFIWDSILKEIHGEKEVDGVTIMNLKTGKKESISCKGVFVFVGLTPNTGFLRGFVELDDQGFVITDEEMRTSRAGVFACGDCRKKALRQIVTACGDGAVAAHSAREYVEKLKGISYPESFQGM